MRELAMPVQSAASQNLLFCLVRGPTYLGFNITRNTPRTALSERTPGVLSGRRSGHSSRSVPARAFRLASTTDAFEPSDARGFRRNGPARPRDDSTDPDPGVVIQFHLTEASGREEARER